MAKKLAEEAIEVVIDAVNGNRDAVIRESADLLYNLTVLWASAGVRPEDVWARDGAGARSCSGSPRNCPNRRSSSPSPTAVAPARRPIVAVESAQPARKRR